MICQLNILFEQFSVITKFTSIVKSAKLKNDFFKILDKNIKQNYQFFWKLYKLKKKDL
jgi:hypothetical protein